MASIDVLSFYNFAYVRLLLSRKWMISFMLSLFLNFGSPTGPEICPNDEWIQVHGTCQLHVNFPKSWSEARRHCWNHGARLPIFDDKFENIKIYERTDLTGQWIGMFAFNGKLWWDRNPPEPVRPEDFKDKWHSRLSNLADNSCAIVRRFTILGFINITLDMVSGSELRTFTCIRKKRSYMELEDDPGCLPSFLKSAEDMDYCVTYFNYTKSFKAAQNYCKEINASLWTPTKEFDFDYMRNFMSQKAIPEMHMDEPARIMDLRSWNYSKTSGSCHYVSVTHLLPGNCTTKRRFLCRLSKKGIPKDVYMELISLPKDGMRLSKDTYLVNSSNRHNVTLGCVATVDNVWIKDGFYRILHTRKEIFNNELGSNIPSLTLLLTSYVQGTYACTCNLYESGWKTSNDITLLLNDIFVSWLYVEVQIDIDLDLSPYDLTDYDKGMLKNSIMPNPFFFVGDEMSEIYPEELINTGDISNTVILKFGCYSKISNPEVTRMSLVTGKKKQGMDYLSSYLSAAELTLKLIISSKAKEISKFISDFAYPKRLSRKKRQYGPIYPTEDLEVHVTDISGITLKDTWICRPTSVESGGLKFHFDAGLPEDYANSTSICPNWEMSPLALGYCNGSLKYGYSWEVVQIYDCKPTARSDVTDELINILSSMNSTIEENVIEQIEKISAAKNSKFTYVDVRIMADIVLTASKSVENLDHKNGQRLANIVSNTMLAPMKNVSDFIAYKENVAKTKLRLSKSLEYVAERVLMEESQMTLQTNRFVVRINEGKHEGLSFGLAENNNQSDVYVDGEDDIRMDDISAAITIPQSAYQGIANRTTAKIRTSFIIYKHGEFFNNDGCYDDEGHALPVVSHVISGKVKDLTLDNLSERIKLKFKINKNIKSPPTCVFISEDDDDVNWQWSSDGITLEHYNSTTGILECSSNHLTNFAVISGFCGDPSSTTAKYLTYISIIGSVLSIICLSFLILCQMFFKKFRKGQFQVALLNLSIALIVVNLLVLLGLDRTSNRTGCIIVAALLHYFLLVSFAWMLIEAILQYYKFVKVFNVHVSKFVLKTVLPAWILPAVVVGITAAIDYNLFRGPKYYCWLAKKAFHYAFLLPLGLMVVSNTFIFIRIIKGISCDRPKGMQTNQSKSRLVWLQVQVGICCFVVMGLTWGFALFAFGKAALVMQFLFAIFNSLQGFFIFVLFVLREKSLRKAWYDLMCGSKTGKHAISSDNSAGLRSKDRKRGMKDDVAFMSSDACLFKNTNHTNDTLFN